MSENDQQAQGQAAPTNTETNARQESIRGQEGQQDNSHMIPKGRLNEEIKKRREIETELAQIKETQEREQEERQQQKGEYQKLSEKYKGDLAKEKAAHAETKQAWQRERRINVWNQAAQGIVKPEAVSDAFSFLAKEELDNIDDTDPEAYKPLAQTLVELKPYLAADGPRGAGSGGSAVPVLGHRGSPNGQRRDTQTTDRKPLFHDQQRKRKPWK